MGERKKQEEIVSFGRLMALGSRAVTVCAGCLAAVALLWAVGCQQKAGVRPSAGEPGKPAAAASKVEKLNDSMCVFCHPQQPETIAARGAKHKTEVGCTDCHVEHPPAGAGAIPECSTCHSGKPHYELEQCSSCHTDAHAPLDLTLEGEITSACLTCHQQQGDEVKKHPSAHTDLPCNQCHAAHKQIPQCTQCHEKHTEDMDFNACVTCHPVHMPLVITYPQDIPSHYCAACHAQAMDLLQKNTTKHHDLACAYCHRDTHKMVPPCTTCHGKPHPDEMLKKFPACGDCHGIAHDLKG